MPKPESLKLTVALIQPNTVWKKKEENFAKVEKLMSAINEPIDVVALPEMFATGFVVDKSAYELAEDENGFTCEFLSELAKKYKTYVIGTYIEKQNQGKPKNTAIVFDREGKEIAKYHKIHLFSYDGEDKIYEPGNEIVTFDINGIRVCIGICYDLRFPEEFRISAKQNKPEIFFIPANWPSKRQEDWEFGLEAITRFNQACVCGINRVGKSPTNDYNGGTAIVVPKYSRKDKVWDLEKNSILYDEGILIKKIDFKEINLKEWRDEFPVLEDIKLISPHLNHN